MSLSQKVIEGAAGLVTFRDGKGVGMVDEVDAIDAIE